mmetsp:Transcript_134222/g.347642  ORF Transcript_134222/g.347642 Transcript_134222/m.347642 type:complete len:231 (-) Transcript_134222:253-945(-)
MQHRTTEEADHEMPDVARHQHELEQDDCQHLQLQPHLQRGFPRPHQQSPCTCTDDLRAARAATEGRCQEHSTRHNRHQQHGEDDIPDDQGCQVQQRALPRRRQILELCGCCPQTGGRNRCCNNCKGGSLLHRCCWSRFPLTWKRILLPSGGSKRPIICWCGIICCRRCRCIGCCCRCRRCCGNLGRGGGRRGSDHRQQQREGPPAKEERDRQEDDDACYIGAEERHHAEE